MTPRKQSPQAKATAPQVVAQAGEQSVKHHVERRKDDRRRSENHPVYDVDPRHIAQSVEGILLGLATKQLKKAVHQAIELGLIQAMINADGGIHVSKPTKDAQERAEQSGTLDSGVVVQNGVRHPQFGSRAGELWVLFAEASKTGVVTLTRARELAEQNGFNPSSAGIALYKWRRFHGVKNVRD